MHACERHCSVQSLFKGSGFFFFGVGRKKIDLSSHSSIVWFCSIQVAIAIPTQLAAGHI